jgi:hypothetical protein
MAKRRQRRTRLDSAAVSIGAALGTVAKRMESWRQTRDEISAEIRQLVSAGNRMLEELGRDAGAKLAFEVPLPRAKRQGRRKGFKVSAATRAKLKAAWAKRRKSKGNSVGNGRKRRKMSAAARARISAAQKARWAKLKQGA